MELIERYTGQIIEKAARELSMDLQPSYVEYLGRQSENIEQSNIELYLKEWQEFMSCIVCKIGSRPDLSIPQSTADPPYP